ncbi:MAG: DNA-3-methyladenine glycosylase 2 family protein [Gemmatimonadetes bacterium]|nr:DNA-3-methyladenine glycosylase 2 family protein [Gemmatimonadota bacterium]
MERSLPYREPLPWERLLAFLGARAIPGVEAVEDGAYLRTIELDGHRGWVAVRAAPAAAALVARLSPTLAPVGDAVAARLRRLFDLDADPTAVAARLGADPLLGPHVRRTPGLRVPGAIDGFELALRAILGQQVSVAAARTLAGRFAERFGEAAGLEGSPLRRLMVRPEVLAAAERTELLALGITGARADTILALARAVAEGALRLEPDGDIDATLAALRRIRGIGPWTAQYVAMRALRHPDAFPAGDLGLRKAIGDGARLEEVQERWRPFRAYAALYLWESLSAPER